MRGRLPGVPSSNVHALPGVSPGHKKLDKDRAAKIAKQLRPKGMSREAGAVWTRLAPDLVAIGRLKRLTVDSFQEYCEAKAELDRLRKFFKDKKGYTYSTVGRHGTQQKAYPQVGQYNQVRSYHTSLCAHWGLTPAAELRFDDNQGDLFDGNEFDDLPGG